MAGIDYTELELHAVALRNGDVSYVSRIAELLGRWQPGAEKWKRCVKL